MVNLNGLSHLGDVNDESIAICFYSLYQRALISDCIPFCLLLR